MNKIALITGATAGIGEATSIALAQKGYNLILCGRRSGRLDLLKEKLLKEFEVEIQCLAFDIRSQKETELAIGSLAEDWKKIAVLINNAGLAAGKEKVQEALISDWDQMIDTNVKGLLYISRIISPLMIERKSGHIINVGSIAGKETYGGGSVYCGTKHAVEAITGAMRIDLIEHGIKVSSVCPGLVETEFSLVRFKGDEEKAEKVYDGFQPLKGNDIADVIVYMLSAPEHVNIADVLILPKAQAASTIVHKK